MASSARIQSASRSRERAAPDRAAAGRREPDPAGAQLVQRTAA